MEWKDTENARFMQIIQSTDDKLAKLSILNLRQGLTCLIFWGAIRFFKL
jgi:hypothetical protein